MRQKRQKVVVLPLLRRDCTNVVLGIGRTPPKHPCYHPYYSTWLVGTVAYCARVVSWPPLVSRLRQHVFVLVPVDTVPGVPGSVPHPRDQTSVGHWLVRSQSNYLIDAPELFDKTLVDKSDNAWGVPNFPNRLHNRNVHRVPAFGNEIECPNKWHIAHLDSTCHNSLSPSLSWSYWTWRLLWQGRTKACCPK
jgi:hypothetical protein